MITKLVDNYFNNRFIMIIPINRVSPTHNPIMFSAFCHIKPASFTIFYKDFICYANKALNNQKVDRNGPKQILFRVNIFQLCRRRDRKILQFLFSFLFFCSYSSARQDGEHLLPQIPKWIQVWILTGSLKHMGMLWSKSFQFAASNSIYCLYVWAASLFVLKTSIPTWRCHCHVLQTLYFV